MDINEARRISDTMNEQQMIAAAIIAATNAKKYMVQCYIIGYEQAVKGRPLDTEGLFQMLEADITL